MNNFEPRKIFYCTCVFRYPSIMSENGDRGLEDCYYFLYSTCRKGDECEYRHNEETKTNPVLCERWSQRKDCTLDCPQRHSYHHLKRRRVDDLCYWETQAGGCTKKFCEYRHRDPHRDAWKNSAGASAEAVYEDRRGPRQNLRPYPNEGYAGTSGKFVENADNHDLNGGSNASVSGSAPVNGNRWFKTRSMCSDNGGEQQTMQSTPDFSRRGFSSTADSDRGLASYRSNTGGKRSREYSEYNREYNDKTNKNMRMNDNQQAQGTNTYQKDPKKYSTCSTDGLNEENLDREAEEIDALLYRLDLFLNQKGF